MSGKKDPELTKLMRIQNEEVRTAAIRDYYRQKVYTLKSEKAMNAQEHEYNLRDNEYDIKKISDKKLDKEIAMLEEEQRRLEDSFLLESRRRQNDTGNTDEDSRETKREVNGTLKRAMPSKFNAKEYLERVKPIDEQDDKNMRAGISVLSKSEIDEFRAKLKKIPKKPSASIDDSERLW